MNSEQLFTDVEVNRPGYSLSREFGEVNILGFSPTLRWIITLAYTNQWISEVKNYNFWIIMPYFKFVNKLEVEICVVLALQFLLLLWNWGVEFYLKIKIYLGKHPNQISSLSFVLIGMAFSFIFSLKLSGNRAPCYQFRVQSCEPGISKDIPR